MSGGLMPTSPGGLWRRTYADMQTYVVAWDALMDAIDNPDTQAGPLMRFILSMQRFESAAAGRAAIEDAMYGRGY